MQFETKKILKVGTGKSMKYRTQACNFSGNLPERLPAFYFNYWLTGIGDNIAGNCVKIQIPILTCVPINVTYNPWNIPTLFTV